MGLRQGKESLSLLVENAVREGLVTAFAGAWGTSEGEKDFVAFGEIVKGSGKKCASHTIFDIASVTKVVGTTTLLALLMEAGKLDFDMPLGTFLPHYAASSVTIRELATHYSGLTHLPPGTDKEMEKALMEARPTELPGSSYLYSCINFHILSRVVEKVSGEKIEEFARKRIFEPLGMKDTSWGETIDLSRTAESVNAPPGIISDEWARSFMPKRTGNAGIFSTMEDLGKFARMMLHRGKGFFKSNIVEKELFRVSSPPGKRDLRSFGYNAAPDGFPEGFSPETVFHTGWTGQSLFLDPVRGIYCIILTVRKGDNILSAAFRRKAAAILTAN